VVSKRRGEKGAVMANLIKILIILILAAAIAVAGDFNDYL